MKEFLLTKVRLSTYFWVLFVVFVALTYALPSYKFDAGSLALFSVNSFLYGFYISPVLAGQKNRIDALHLIVRGEANALFELVLGLKKLPTRLRNELQEMVVAYVRAKLRSKKSNGGEDQYEAIISYCLSYKGEHTDQVERLLANLVKNQKNRTDFNMQIGNKVFSNEWHIIAILFSITLGFIMTISIPDSPVMHVVKALLCTGLTMLIINLIKLNSLTHKKAKQMWKPFRVLIDTNFYRID